MLKNNYKNTNLLDAKYFFIKVVSSTNHGNSKRDHYDN